MEYNGYRIVHDGTFGLYTIKPLSRGGTPKELKGRFTAYGSAQAAIDSYVKGKKGTTNAETNESR